jgi:hypothetical protein
VFPATGTTTASAIAATFKASPMPAKMINHGTQPITGNCATSWKLG